MYSLLEGRLTLTQEFKEGALGTRLWYGEHETWGEVVVKTIPRPRDPGDLKKRRGYFKDEAECGRLLASPFIRSLFDAGEIEHAPELAYANGIFYLVLEKMKCSLEDELRKGSVTPSDVRDLVWAIAQGLNAAHTGARPIVHRDLKPSNILLGDGSCASAKLADFGIARMEGGTRLTSTLWTGTDRYMAPEQFDSSSDVDARADIYAFALIIWECLAGEVPHDECDPIATMRARKRGAPLSILEIAGVARPAIRDVLGHALSVDPEDRPRNVSEFAMDVLVAGSEDDLWVPNPGHDGFLRSKFVMGGTATDGPPLEDLRPTGGSLWVYGSRDLGPGLGALLPRVRWMYSERRAGWFTKDPSIVLDHLLIPEAPRGPSKVATRVRKRARVKATEGPNPAFMKPMQPDDVLGAVVGNSPMPRTEITKRLWAYISKNGLQDAKQRRMINADDKLSRLFGGKKQVSMFDMTKLVNAHMRAAQ